MSQTKIDSNPDIIYSPGVMAIVRNAVAAYKRITPRVRKMRKAGLSMGQIAATLNEAGEVTRQGSKFYAATVRCIIKRSGGDPAQPGGAS
jgi:hypothetical protein